MLSPLLKDLYKINDPEKNNAMVNLIKSKSKDLQKETKKMSKNEKKKKKKKNEKPDEIIEFVEEILQFNKQLGNYYILFIVQKI